MPTPMQLRLDGSTLWLGGECRRLTDEDRTVLEQFGRRAAAWNRNRGDAWLTEIGRELRTWLGAWGERLRAPNLTLNVVADDAVVREAPWELLHDGAKFLVDGGFEVVRRLEPASALTPPPPEHGLTLVFMAASPRSHRPGISRLRYEDEEAAILRAVGDRKLLLSVDETGTARGLGERLNDLAQEAPSPIVHITCHGTASPPALVLEDDRGGEALTSAAELLAPDGAGFRLTEASLVVVSACATAEPDVGSFVVELVRGSVRAVLGWSASVSDAQATIFASNFYENLREGAPLDRALNAARRHLKQQKHGENTDWHLARLVAGPQAGGPVVKKGGLLPALGIGSRAFAGNRKVEIATRLQFVGRRPQIQEALQVLEDGAFAGVLVTGLGHQGKSSLAGRLADRHRGSVVVCWGAEEMTAPAILLKVHEALGQAGEPQAVSDRAAMTEDPGGLEGKLLRTLERETRPLLLVLDDVEQVLDLGATPVRVKSDFERTLRGALAAFRRLTLDGRRHRLVLTSRVAFHLPGWDGQDLVQAALREVHLAGMQSVERALLPVAREAELPVDARARCLEASAGNPGLAALIFSLARDLAKTGELVRLPQFLAGHPGASPRQGELDDWMEKVVDVLVARLSDTQRHLLYLSRVLPGPVPRAAVLAALGPVAAATDNDAKRLEALGLWEQHRDEVIAPAPLALRRAPLLEEAMRRDLARSILAELRSLWTPPPTDLPRARVMVELCLTAEQGEELAAPSEVVLASLLAVHETLAARDLGRQIVKRLTADGLPIPNKVRIQVADAVEAASTDEALALLDGVSNLELVLLRQGRLRRRIGDLDGAELCFRNFAALRHEDPHDHALAQAHVADILRARGQLDEALRILKDELLPVFERLGDARSRAIAMGQLADILQVRGEHDEALRIRKDEELPVYERLGDVRSRAVTMGQIADILEARGQLDEALQLRKDEELTIYKRLGDVRCWAITMRKIAEILETRGQLDEALHIHKNEVFPIFERLGDVHERAATMGKIADILEVRGELDEAHRIRKDEELPVYERLGIVRSWAVTMGKIADILEARGELDEALRIRMDEELPVFERLGDVRSRALTLGSIADILEARGELDEALRIRTDEELPVYKRLGDVRSWAATMSRIADILEARGELDEALRIRKDEALPVYERLGDVREILVARVNVAVTLLKRRRAEDGPEILSHLFESLAAARKHGYLVEARQIEDFLQQLGLDADPDAT